MLPSALDAQFGTPYPRSAGFDIDIGAFIESSSVSSLLGLMAPTIIDGDAVQGETFLPGQIFVFYSCISSTHRPGSDATVGDRSMQFQKKFLRSRKIYLGRKVSPWTASLSMIEGAIKPNDDDTEELSMKAPMLASKLADLG